MAYRIGLMSTGFKRLAKQTYGRLTLSQFNREVNDGQRPSMENLRDLGRLNRMPTDLVLVDREEGIPTGRSVK